MEDYHAYCSPVMLVRYSEEEVKLQDVVVFSTELEVVEECLSVPLVLEVELLFSDILGSAFADYSSMELVPEKEMKSVSVVSYRISKPCSGLSEFFRVCFDEMHFSTLSCSFFSLSTHFRIFPKGKSPTKVITSNDLSRALFPSKGGFKEFVGTEAMNRAYAKHVLPFALATERLRIQLLDCVSDSEGIASCPLALVLPAANEFSDVVGSHVCAKVVGKVVSLMQTTAEYTQSFFTYLLSVLREHPEPVSETLFRKYLHLQISKSALATLHFQPDSDMTSESLGKFQAVQAQKQRKNPEFLSTLHNSIESMKVISGPSPRPIFFPDKSIDLASPEQYFRSYFVSKGKQKKRHLVVLVHGFGGTSFDVRKLRNQILLEHADVFVLSAHTNEDEATDGDIIVMGRRLAIETQTFVHDYFPGRSLEKLSFIGHSMGGLVIRAALPTLGELRRKLHFMMTLSTPHLGYIKKSSALVDIGLWVLKKIRHSLSLNQVTMMDDPDPRKCALYELSKYEGMSDFRHILLLSSPQDTYAPFESSRIHINPDTLSSALGPIYSEMAQNILSPLNPDVLRRIDVNFALETDSVDTVIGRAAHIQFLENEPLMQRLIFAFPEMFAFSGSN